jgi:hypothetical protein
LPVVEVVINVLLQEVLVDQVVVEMQFRFLQVVLLPQVQQVHLIQEVVLVLHMVRPLHLIQVLLVVQDV